MKARPVFIFQIYICYFLIISIIFFNFKIDLLAIFQMLAKVADFLRFWKIRPLDPLR